MPLTLPAAPTPPTLANPATFEANASASLAWMTAIAAAMSGSVLVVSDISQGSNANGRWTRFPDGTQICHITDFDLGSTISAGAGTFSDPYRTPSASLTWPASFISAPTVAPSLRLAGDSVVNPQSRALLLLSALPPSNSGWGSVAAMRAANDATARNALLSVIAVGRWS